MRLLKQLPYPIAGLALGMASLGNLLSDISPLLKTILGLLAAIFIVGLIIKALLLPASLKEAFNHPLIAGTMITFPMTLMLLATYILPSAPAVAKVVWVLGVAIAVACILWMIVRFVLRFDIKQVFSSYFVAFVGIAVASITAKAVGFPIVGQIAFWFGLIVYPFLVLVVSYRYLRIKNIPPPARPAFAIYAAPASLLLAAYLSAFETKSPLLVYLIFGVALIMTIIGLVKTLPQLAGPFFPSMSAFTFPFVISAVAMKMFNGWLKATGNPSPIVNAIFWIEFVIAGILVAYTLIRYLIFLFNPPQAA